MARDKGTSSISRKDRFNKLKNKVLSVKITAEFIVRMRWVLLILSFLLLFLAFQVGDDWFVREFANYDWARHIGF